MIAGSFDESRVFVVMSWAVSFLVWWIGVFMAMGQCTDADATARHL
jgi:hypothetical protein